MKFSEKYQSLYSEIDRLYHLPENRSKLLFHGWHHIKFVHDKAIEFAGELGCDVERVAVSALVHDLEYTAIEKLSLEETNILIAKQLSTAGYTADYVIEVSKIVDDAHARNRGKRELSKETMALADADSLFKVLPTTPVLFGSKYMLENKVDIYRHCQIIIEDQKPIMDAGNYFYTESAKQKYLSWARTNLELWEEMLASLNDPAVKEMLDTANELGVL